ncbi:MAG: antibiotic biosynthesis monooxygenase [Gammaproteobacteria bacterium]|nr:antibiotic biosynthesis monooxygenase [Gammaproteobacteria bacterium]
MLAVIFEFEANSDRKQDYLNFAAQLGAELKTIDGFISIERFESLTEAGKLLSLSFWRDEAAISAWRNLQQHRDAQQAGRDGIMADYRLRVANVIRDYGLLERAGAPDDSRAFHGR